MTQKDVVNYIVSQNDELKNTYIVYQKLLYSIKNNNKSLFDETIDTEYTNISTYMKTSIKTLKEFRFDIYNTFSNYYHNGFIEGNNNFIKVIKRIAFGFRSFRRFKAYNYDKAYACGISGLTIQGATTLFLTNMKRIYKLEDEKNRNIGKEI